MCKMLSLAGITADDVVYTVLPLYHVMGFILGVLGCLELGKPFSEDPSNPWDLQTQCQGGTFRVTRPYTLPSTEVLLLTRNTQQQAPRLLEQRFGHLDSP